LRSTSKKPVCPMTRSLDPPMAHCGQRVRFVATWREEFFEVPVNLSVIDDPKEFAKLLFKAGQQPAAWLWSAGHLRDAAEMILRHELQAEISYSLARKIAEGEAAAARLRYDADSAVADIKATAPNYPPAQLLY